MKKPRFSSYEEWLAATPEARFASDPERHKRSLNYEVFCECINIEMAERNALLHEAGHDADQGRLHFEAMNDLWELRDSVHGNDENAVAEGWRVLRAMKAEREKTVNRSESTPVIQNGQRAVYQSGDVVKPVAVAG